jgi:hypothetical protein
VGARFNDIQSIDDMGSAINFAMVIGGGKVAFIIPKLGEHIGQIIGTLIFCPVIFVVTWYSIRWINPNDIRDAIIVGIL